MLSDFHYKFLRQNGSHQIYGLKNGGEVVVPFKKEFPIGTGRNIVKQISESSGIPFFELVKKYSIKL